MVSYGRRWRCKGSFLEVQGGVLGHQAGAVHLPQRQEICIHNKLQRALCADRIVQGEHASGHPGLSTPITRQLPVALSLAALYFCFPDL